MQKLVEEKSVHCGPMRRLQGGVAIGRWRPPCGRRRGAAWVPPLVASLCPGLACRGSTAWATEPRDPRAPAGKWGADKWVSHSAKAMQ